MDLDASTNAYLPACSLPPEVFLRIIGHLATEDPPKISLKDAKDARFRRTVVFGWLVVTQVCRKWRDSCRGAHELWPLPGIEDDELPPHQLPDATRGSDILKLPAHILIGPAFRALYLQGIGDTEVDLDDLLYSLSQLPILETLAIRNCVFNSSLPVARVSEVSTTLPGVSLSRLKSLTLMRAATKGSDLTTHDLASRFLELLHFSKTTHMDILLRSIGGDTGFASVRDTFTAVMLQISRIFESEWQNGVSVFLYPSAMHITFNHMPRPLSLKLLQQPIAWQVQVKLPIKLSVNAVHLQYLREIPDIRVKSLSGLGDNSGLVREAHLRAFNALYGRTRVLYLHGHGKKRPRLLGLPSYLAHTIDDALLFPSLEELWVGSLVILGDFDFEPLCGVLRTRGAAPENRLHTIHVGMAKPALNAEGAEEAETLEPLVPNVVWHEQ
ncbi:unnamed protein product [Peniophora sp. CBMAI 1063]|nr:unnamed protein product [Peniophora sp. CBMAI 1063]